jgi:deazaflavin-dependent oxidoreductase (nitroreductase family)
MFRGPGRDWLTVADGEFKDALQGRSEVDLTVTGRKSGNQSTRPIWFVEDGDRILLLPVSGSDSNWYRNAVKTPEIRLAADGPELRATAKPVDQAGVAEIVEKFGEKYGADRVADYYPKQDAALEVPLG